MGRADHLLKLAVIQEKKFRFVAAYKEPWDDAGAYSGMHGLKSKDRDSAEQEAQEYESKHRMLGQMVVMPVEDYVRNYL